MTVPWRETLRSRLLRRAGLAALLLPAACDGRAVDMGDNVGPNTGNDAGSSDAINSDEEGKGGVGGGGAGGTLIIGGSAGKGASGGSANGGHGGGTAGKGGSGAAAGSDGGSTCASSCPDGCCDENDQCLAGTDEHACGRAGHACVDCTATGWLSCDPDTQSCSFKMDDCHLSNCPSGCCEPWGSSGQVCLDGTSPKACGTAAQTCKDCGGNDCDPGLHACLPYKCVCGGRCCLGGLCVPGIDPWACGNDGKECVNCTLTNQTCQVEFGGMGGQCKPPLCSTSNCSGCCVGDVCAVGTQDNACGVSGGTCEDCKAHGKYCQGGTCV